MFTSVNVGNNMAPFSVLYKGYIIARDGDIFVVRKPGNPLAIGYYRTPFYARQTIDALAPSIPNGMHGLGEGSITPHTAMLILGGVAVAMMIGHHLTASKHA